MSEIAFERFENERKSMLAAMSWKERLDHAVQQWSTRLALKDAELRIRVYDKIVSYLPASAESSDDRRTLNTIVEQLGGEYAKHMPRASITGFFRFWAAGKSRAWRHSYTLRPFIPTAELMIIAAGEEVGGDEVRRSFQTCIAMARDAERINSTLRMIKIQFFFYGSLAAGMLTGVSKGMLKALDKLLTPERLERLPGYAQIFIDVCKGFTAYGVFYIAGFVLIAALTAYSLPRLTGSLRPFLDKLPPWLFYRINEGTSLLMAVRALMESNMTLKKALTEIEKTASPYTKRFVVQIKASLGHGMTPGEALNVPLFLKDTIVDIGVAARSNNFAGAIPLIVENAVKNAERTAKTAQKTMFWVFVAVLVTLMLLMYLTNFAIPDVLKQ